MSWDSVEYTKFIQKVGGTGQLRLETSAGKVVQWPWLCEVVEWAAGSRDTGFLQRFDQAAALILEKESSISEN